MATAPPATSHLRESARPAVAERKPIGNDAESAITAIGKMYFPPGTAVSIVASRSLGSHALPPTACRTPMAPRPSSRATAKARARGTATSGCGVQPRRCRRMA
jgi:hypothetical protein